MDIGIGLPASIPGVEKRALLDWARSAEQRGFSTLAAIDRVVYPNYEPLIALTAAAAVTDRIRLTTVILLGPLRTNAALFAKEAASLDSFSGGRFVLGIAVGSREEDFAACGVDMHTRGRKMNESLALMQRIWNGERFGYDGAIGPPPARPGGPELIIGGASEATITRTIRFGDGWICGLRGGVERFKRSDRQVHEAWQAAGRAGSPRNLAISHYSLGPNAEQDARATIGRYYEHSGAYADEAVADCAKTAEEVRERTRAFAEAGCAELIWMPSSTDTRQIQLLAEAVGLSEPRAGQSAG